MRCCVIEGRKFSILSNREKGNFYSAECYFFLCRYAIPTEDKVIEEKGIKNMNKLLDIFHAISIKINVCNK